MTRAAAVLIALAVLAISRAHATIRAVEDSSLLQKLEINMARRQPEPDAPSTERGPHVIALRRESVPVYRRGKVASFKTSYSGVLHVGTPAQEFRVVFDTGSGNIVLPASECTSEACLVADRRKFNMSSSSTALAINQDGSEVPVGGECDQVTIGFGTGEITGEFARDTVCFGAPFTADEAAAQLPPAVDTAADGQEVAAPGQELVAADAPPARQRRAEDLCVEMSVVLAVEMSTQPFKTFRFDGILGLGLGGLAMAQEFSAFEMLLGTGLPNPHFGVFLTEGEDGEESEIAFGGLDQRRLMEPALSWAPVAMPELGYWQVEIKSVRIAGKALEVCEDGTCRGVVDTGTSHLGVPAPADKEVADLLTTEAGDLLDCRLAEAPEMEIELVGGYVLTLHPHNYMRRLPLREGVSVSSAQGVHVAPPAEAPVGQPNGDGGVANVTGNASDAAGVVGGGAAPLPPQQHPEGGAAEAGSAATPQEVPQQVQVGAEGGAAVPVAPAPEQDGRTAPAAGAVAVPAEEEEEVRRFCRPRLMPVRLPEPLGPKLFILGEPVLHRYYTVYDWGQHRVGFGLAKSRNNMIDPAEAFGGADRRGVLPKDVDVLLMQQSVKVSRSSSTAAAVATAVAAADGESPRTQELSSDRAPLDGEEEETMLVQVEVTLRWRRRTVPV